MNRLIVPAFVMTCCATAFAQTPDTTKQTPMKGMKDSVTVTGCVAESTPAGHFMLNNASMSHDAMKKDTSTPPSTPTPSGSMADKMSSYMLVGGDNLKAHVGHKVEVTGALSMAKPKADERMPAQERNMGAQELKVQSIKMVSATCP